MLNMISPFSTCIYQDSMPAPAGQASPPPATGSVRCSLFLGACGLLMKKYIKIIEELDYLKPKQGCFLTSSSSEEDLLISN